MSLFKGTIANPYHVSVGAIIRDDKGDYILIKSGDKFSFMCGTIENNESPQQTLRRELHEELGAFGHVIRFAGSSLIDATVEMGADFPFQKCILWFEVELGAMDYRDATDPQGQPIAIDYEQLKIVNKDNGRWPHGIIGL